MTCDNDAADRSIAITVDDVRRLLDGGAPVTFVDSRSPTAWRVSKIKIRGAVRGSTVEGAARWGALPRDQLLVVYCACTGDDSSARLARGLIALGFNAAYLQGGFDAWLGAGLPLEPR